MMLRVCTTSSAQAPQHSFKFPTSQPVVGVKACARRLHRS